MRTNTDDRPPLAGFQQQVIAPAMLVAPLENSSGKTYLKGDMPVDTCYFCSNDMVYKTN